MGAIRRCWSFYPLLWMMQFSAGWTQGANVTCYDGLRTELREFVSSGTVPIERYVSIVT